MGLNSNLGISIALLNGDMKIDGQLAIQVNRQKQREMYVEMVEEAKGPLRPSSVTTSKPTLSPPSLISPAHTYKHGITGKITF